MAGEEGGPRKRLMAERWYLLMAVYTIAKGHGVPQTFIKITKSKESALVWVCPKIYSCDANISPKVILMEFGGGALG